MQVFANHAHVFPASVNADATIERLLRMLDACGIDQAVCFAPFPSQLRATGINGNQWLAGELVGKERLFGFGTIDMARADRREQVREARQLGLRGLKLHPNAQQFDLLCPEAHEVYDEAEKQGLFITFHSGVHHYRLLHYDVLKFDEVAWNHRDLRFSMEHVGGYHFFPQALAVIVNNIPFPPVPGRRCMVYGGLSSIFTPNYNRFWYMSRDRLLELIAQAGCEQLIFGLDFPYNLEDNTRLALKTLRELKLPQDDLAKILGGNLREALGIAAQ